MREHPDLEARRAFLGIEKGDEEQLAELRPLVEEHADEIVAAFYRHLLAFDETRNLLRDRAVRDRLLEAQKYYLLSLVSDPIDDAYLQRRRAIGLTHERIGLAPAWYLGAYQIYLRELGLLIDQRFAADRAAAQLTHETLQQRILLDMQLAMDAYIGEREVQLEFLNRELAASQHGLTQEVDEKTRALQVTRERAHAAEQLASVGTLAAGLAHEIGTPMGVIRGHAESLVSRASDDRSRWRLDTIIEQIDRITNIMQSLLNLARPRAPVREPVSPAEIIETAASFIGEKLRRSGIEIERRLDADVGLIQADGEKLQQLFLNLLLNAADAMPEGGTLSLALDSTPTHVRARIADSGVGIAAKDLERIFDPFFTSKEAGKGSGLGLVVASGIAVDHGGEIEVTSTPGVGTEFIVTLARG